MTEGLIWSYGGRVAICLVLAFLGLIVSAILTGVVLVRKAPPLTTQRDVMSGTTQHGIGRWFLGFAAVFVGLPLMALVVVTGFEVTHWAADHIALAATAAATVVLLAVAAGLAIRARRDVPVVEAPALAAQPTRPSPARDPLWTMPPIEKNWNQR